jgi:hypothetical protein
MPTATMTVDSRDVTDWRYRLRVTFPLTRIAALFALFYAHGASAQTAPQADSAGPDEVPSIKVGAVIFPDYTFTLKPKTTDADGNTIHFNEFNVTRAFIDVSGKLTRIVSFRVTPDVARETSAFSDNEGSVELRIFYAYAQFNFDDWMPKDSYARFGIQPTPWLGFAEDVYRYRFQGAMFTEREGYLAAADAGAAFHYTLPSDHGDLEIGVYNGEGFNKAEANEGKALMFRGTLRPVASTSSVLHGLRASFFYDSDSYVKNGPRNRLVAAVTFEHPVLNAGFEFLDATDRTSITRPEIDGRGYSVWATPKSSKGFEGLLRYDRLEPNTAIASQAKNRTIVGVAYWFPHQGAVMSAVLLDYDGQTFRNFLPAQATQSKLAVHGLVRF